MKHVLKTNACLTLFVWSERKHEEIKFIFIANMEDHKNTTIKSQDIDINIYIKTRINQSWYGFYISFAWEI